MTLTRFTVLAHIVAALVAVVVARRRRGAWPVALFLLVTAVADLLHGLIAVSVFEPRREMLRAQGIDPASVPLAGMTLVWAGLDCALFLTWAFGIAALGVAVFAAKPRNPLIGVALAWAATSVVMAVVVPRGEALRNVYFGADVACLALALLVFLSWIPRREGAGVARVSFMGIWLIELSQIILLGPWRYQLFERWDLAQVAYIVMYVILIVLLGALYGSPEVH